MKTKTCSRCNKIKPISEFGKNNGFNKCVFCRENLVKNHKTRVLKLYEEDLIKCVKCRKIKNKSEFYLREERFTTTSNNTFIPHLNVCKDCVNAYECNKIQKKEELLKKKWLGYETDIYKITKFLGYYSKDSTKEPYKRWYFEIQCKYCGNTEIAEVHKLNQLKDKKSCYLCRCSIKINENIKRCSRCKQWFPITDEYFNFYDSTIKRGGKSNYYCHTCQSIVNKKIRLNAKKSGKDIEYRKSIQNKINEQRKRMYKTNPEFKMKHTIRNHINRVTRLKNDNEHTVDILGCEWNFFIKHIEAQFYSNMSWNNHGVVWTYDHIIPLSIAKGDINVLKELSKWWNMSPIFKINNNKKNCTVPLISTPSNIINKLIIEVYEKKHGMKFIPTEFRVLDLNNFLK